MEEPRPRKPEPALPPWAKLAPARSASGKHSCSMVQLKKVSGGRKGYEATFKCRGCKKILVLKWTHALYKAWRRYKGLEETDGPKDDS